MQHAITVKELLIGGGILFAIVGVGALVLAFLEAIAKGFSR